MTLGISPTRTRYIKLGEGGRWEHDCLKTQVIRIGFGSVAPARFALCSSGRWDDVAASFVSSGRSKGTATRFTKELRLFFEDDGTVLWITFIGDCLYWGFTDGPPVPNPDQDGVDRPIKNGWRNTDLSGEPLTSDRLSGAVTKLTAYRGTSCDVDKSDYVIRRISGQKVPEVERALAVSLELKQAILDLMRLLGPRDFELLVDLVFTNSGWRRIGVVGKTQKTLDLDLILPSTGERAFVQVKSHTTSAELTDYVAQLDDRRMFYVFHSGEAATDDERVSVIGPEQLADLVMDAGLTSWLIRKVS